MFLLVAFFFISSQVVVADFTPVDCVWSDWGNCSKDCGTGIQFRTHAVEAKWGGAECTGPYSQWCNTQPCPVNCVWSNWSTCSVDCGGGTQSRTHAVEAQWGGSDCTGPYTQSCNNNPCPIDCVWSDWSACSAPCGGGTQTRYHAIEKKYGGNDCLGSDHRTCNVFNCPINCVWSDWSACSVDCGGGTKTRSHLVEARYNGQDCVGSSTASCNEGVCSDIGSGGFKPPVAAVASPPPIIILTINNVTPTPFPTRVPTIKQADVHFDIIQLFSKPTSTPAPVLPSPTPYTPPSIPTAAPTSIQQQQQNEIVPTPTVKPESFIPEAFGSQTNTTSQQTSVTLNTQILKDIKIAINKIVRTPTEKPLLPQEQRLLTNNSPSSSYGGITVSLEQKTGTQFVTQQDELTVKRGNQFFSISNQATTPQSTSNTQSGLSEQLEINANNVIALSSMGLSIDPLSGVLTVDTPNGPKKVSIMPDEALGIVVELKALNTRGVIEPSILLVSEKGSLIYRISGEKVEKFLGLFPLPIRKQILVSADTGSVVKVELSLLSQILSFFTF